MTFPKSNILFLEIIAHLQQELENICFPANVCSLLLRSCNCVATLLGSSHVSAVCRNNGR